jgi:outer membrane protein
MMTRNERTYLRCLRGLTALAALFVAVAPAAAQLEERLAAMDKALEKIYDGDPVTLEQCLAVAEAGSANLGRLEEDVFNSNVDVRRAYSLWFPDLSLTYYWQRDQRTDFDVPVSTTPPVSEDVLSIFTNKGATLQSTWTVFDGLNRESSIGRAKSLREANEQNLDYQETLLVQTVSNAYVDYLRAIARVKVAEEAEELALKELERSQTYFDLGISTRSDVLQQKVLHQQTQLDTVRERNNQRNAFAVLAHAMNVPAAEPFEVVQIIADEVQMDVPELDPLLNHALAEREDIHAYQDMVQVQNKSVTQARAGFYPSLQIFGSVGITDQDSPQQLRLGAQRARTLRWGIQGRWNLFDRFLTKQQSRQAVANRRRAEYDLQQARLDTELEIVQVRNHLIEAKERYGVAKITVEQAEENLRLAQERFRVGAGTSLDVINAQVGLAQGRRDVVDAVADFLKYRNELDRAVGGSVQ